MQIARTYADNTDEELVTMVVARTRGAFDELYQRYGQKMFSYFFRMLWKNKELAEDCTQDLFLKIIRHSEKYVPGRQFSTWLYSIANNMCKNEYRKAAVRNKFNEMKIVHPVTKQIDPDLRIFRETVHSCTASLPDEKKTLFILRFQEQLQVSQISEIMSIPEGTVKSRIFYLLKEMKEKLKDFEAVGTG